MDAKNRHGVVLSFSAGTQTNVEAISRREFKVHLPGN